MLQTAGPKPASRKVTAKQVAITESTAATSVGVPKRTPAQATGAPIAAMKPGPARPAAVKAMPQQATGETATGKTQSKALGALRTASQAKLARQIASTSAGASSRRGPGSEAKYVKAMNGGATSA